jgi:ABC-2 type transport system permease protein
MRIRALIVRILRQFRHDKRTMALMFIAPLLILTLVSYVFNGDTAKPRIAAVNLPAPVVDLLSASDAVLVSYPEQEADAILRFADGGMQVKLEGSDPARNRAVLLLLRQAFAPNSAAGEPQVSYLHGSADMAAFDNFGPVLLGFFSFFFVFLIGGISFLRERTNGTLERLLATPLRKWEIVTGYVLGFGFFTLLQSALVVWFAIYVLGLLMVGSFPLLLLVIVLLSLTALTLGILLSTFASNEFQMIQFIPIAIIPQVFFSGLFDLDTMAPWLRWLSTIMPLKYGADALRDIMIRGYGFSSVLPSLLVLTGLSIVFMLLNILALRKHRRI